MCLFRERDCLLAAYELGPGALGPGWLRAGMYLGEAQLWGAGGTITVV